MEQANSNRNIDSFLINSINKFFSPDFKKYRIGILCGDIGISDEATIKESLSMCKELWILIEDKESGIEASSRIREVYSIEGVDRVLLYKGDKNLTFMINQISPNVRFLQKKYRGKNYPGSKSNIPVHHLNF